MNEPDIVMVPVERAIYCRLLELRLKSDVSEADWVGRAILEMYWKYTDARRR